MEQEKGLFREKDLYNYTYVLKACEATGAPHIAMFEDDVVAIDGWYHRTRSGINQADKECIRNSRKPSDFFYLRPFYTEEFLGWSGEDVHIHLYWSVAAVVASGLAIFCLRSCISHMRRLLTPLSTLAICFVAVSLAIVLVFAAGKTSVLPLPTGVNVTDK
jgi:hypothetical protein